MASTSDLGPTDPVRRSRGEGLASGSFIGLLVTQFLGATNDNIFRWLAVGIGKDYFPQHAELYLSLGVVCLVLPYLFLAAPAGYAADRFSKRTVVVGAKLAEIFIMSVGVLGIYLGNLYIVFGVLFLMGAQSAMYSPAKLGAIPEIVPASKISAANGVVGLTSVVATVVGAVVGNYLADWTKPYGTNHLWVSAVTLIGIALVGWLASLMIGRLASANPSLPFPSQPVRQSIKDLATLAQSLAMLRVALGITFFWSIGSLAQVNIDQFGAEGGLLQRQIAPLLVSLVVGVGLGSVLAGIWSGGKVELGILPLGAGGVAISSMLLFTVAPDLKEPDATLSAAFAWSCFWLFTLGCSAGLFDVPLTSYIQDRSPPKSRGSILAASNFLCFSGILASAGLFWLLRYPVGPQHEPLFTSRQIFLLCGVLTVPVFVYIIWLLPDASLRFIVWLLSHTVYRVRVYGRENLPDQGGALLVPNHVTWIDGFLLLITSSRPIRMLIYADYVDKGWRKVLADVMGAIPIKAGSGRRALVESLQTARRALEQGELVCIFPEGAITRSGQLQEFKPGMMKIVKGTGVPVIPVYLDELWGSIFSFSGGKFFWKWPRRWPYPVSIHIGRPIPETDDVHRIRQAVQDLGVVAVERRKTRRKTLAREFLTACRRSMFRSKVADSTGANLTGGRLLLSALIFRRLLLRQVLAADERFVGVLLPPSVGGVLANMALPLAHRVPVNLNYTVSPEVMNSCIQQCGIKHVLTSRKVMQKLPFTLDAEPVYVEDFRSQITKADKLAAGFDAYALPVWALERKLGLLKIQPDDLLTVVFTSGSTGEPKGVMLSYSNIGSNVDGIGQVLHLNKNDVAIGILPFFHSFGFTVTLWAVLTLDPKGVYHFNPLDAKEIGKLCREHKATILMATPTFLRTYLRRCEKEDLASLNLVVAGAEKLPKELSDAFEQKVGVRPVEGYGTTELSPLVSVNVPQSRAWGAEYQGSKEGSVGRPIPGVSAKIVHPDTGENLGFDQPGMLLISGPNVMQGYYNKPELTAGVMRDDWYVTGDIAQIDPAGFIEITGRLSRFSKIGGEMVPHIKIEETLQRVLGGEDELKAVVSAVPDPKRGERLVVLHRPLDKTPEAICRALSEAGLPNLWIPSPDSFCEISEIPVLGTGKLDLKRLKDLALEKFATPVPSA